MGSSPDTFRTLGRTEFRDPICEVRKSDIRFLLSGTCIMKATIVGLFVCAVLCADNSAFGQYVRPRTVESRRTYTRGVYRPDVPDSYQWAVFRPEVMREEMWRRGSQTGHISVWIAKRANASRHMFNSHTYNLFSANGLGLVGKAHGFQWNRLDPPPVVSWYWKERKYPDWFMNNQYQIFYPRRGEEGDRAWWCRRSDGQWDLIDGSELVEEGAEAPRVFIPDFNLASSNVTSLR